MKVLSAYVRDMGGGVYDRWALYIKTEEKYPVDTFVYRTRYLAKSTLYFAEKDGWVDFFADSGRGDGCGGATFTINIVDEYYGVPSRINLKGPWSSSPSSMARYGFTQSVPVHFEDCTFTYITQTMGEKIVKDFNLPYHYESDYDEFAIVLKPN